jgi:PAS domain S-box-containing protein
MTYKDSEQPSHDFTTSLEGAAPESLDQRNEAGDLLLRLTEIVNSAPDAIISTDRDSIIVTWNAAATRLFGYRSAEIAGVSGLLLVPPSLHGEIRDLEERVLGGETIENLHTQMLLRGGGRINVAVTMSPIHDASGSVIGMIKSARDLRGERQIEDAHLRLIAIVDSTSDAIISQDLNGMITTWNRAAERIFGYSAEEIVGRSSMTLIPPESQREELDVIRRILEGEPVEHFETQRLRKGGEQIDVAITVSPIRNSSGSIAGASQIARDISERRRTEETRMRLAAIVESSDDAIIGKDLDGIITSWNSGAKQIFGYEADEIVGHSVMRLIPRELHSEEPMILARLRAGQRVEHYESKRRRKNGELIDVSLTISPIKDSRGNVIGASKIARDITERKRAEAALIEKEKLAATGRMAAAIAHEVNNPLESIMNLAYLLTHDPGLSEKGSYYAGLLLQEVERASEITRQTLSFYRSPSLPGEVDLAQVFDSVVRSKQGSVRKKGIAIETEIEGKGTAWGLTSELGQVISNLIENAIDAVGQDGRIRLRARDINGGESVQISVSDNGSGMPPEIAKRIFEPFFTTKNSRGSGLGLWVTRGIVEKHDGSIRVRTTQSGKRHGAIFTVILPRGMSAKIEEKTALSAD